MRSSLLLLALAAIYVHGSGTGNAVGRGLAGLPCITLSSCAADITGVVENGAGAALVAAAPGVSAKNAVADAAGAYTFPSLPPGTYTVGPAAAEAASFEYLPSSVSVTLSGNGDRITAPKMVRKTPSVPQPGLSCPAGSSTCSYDSSKDGLPFKTVATASAGGATVSVAVTNPTTGAPVASPRRR